MAATKYSFKANGVTLLEIAGAPDDESAWSSGVSKLHRLAPDLPAAADLELVCEDDVVLPNGQARAKGASVQRETLRRKPGESLRDAAQRHLKEARKA